MYGGLDTTTTRTRAWYWNPSDRDWQIQVGLLVWAVAATTGFVYYAVENDTCPSAPRGGLSSLDLECIDHWVGLRMDEVVNGSVPRGSAIVRTSDGAIHATNDHPPEVQAISPPCMNLLHQTLRSNGRQIDTVSTPSTDPTSGGRRLQDPGVTHSGCAMRNGNGVCITNCNNLASAHIAAYNPKEITAGEDTFMKLHTSDFNTVSSLQCAATKEYANHFAVYKQGGIVSSIHGSTPNFAAYDVARDHGTFAGTYAMASFLDSSVLSLPPKEQLGFSYGYIIKYDTNKYVISNNYVAYESQGSGHVIRIGLEDCTDPIKQGEFCEPVVKESKCGSTAQNYDPEAWGEQCIPTYTCPSGSKLYYLMDSTIRDSHGLSVQEQTLAQNLMSKSGGRPIMNDNLVMMPSTVYLNPVSPIYACLATSNIVT